MRILTVVAIGLLLAMGSAGAFAEEPAHEHQEKSGAPAGEGSPPMGQMGQKGMGMHHGMGMHDDDMGQRMRALHDHSKMMEGITDQQKLAQEMKKHMRMMDEMMDKMMQAHREQAGAAPQAP